MQSAETNRRLANFLTLATVVLVVAVLRIAEDVLIPIALSVLLAFLLAPLVVRLTRTGLPKALAIIVTATLAFSVIGAVGWVLTTQVISLAERLPDYEENLQKKIAKLKQPHTPGAFSRATDMLENLQREIKTKAPEPVAAAGAEPKPLTVELAPPHPTPLDLARQIAGPILGPLGVTAIVIVFVIAMLFQRDDLRDRFIKVVSAGRLNLATQAVDDAARRVTRYLVMQGVVNATYGLPIGVGLYFIGIPNPLLWGVLATVLRFIPFLGPWIAASFPVVLSIAVDPGWTMLFYTLALFLVMELVSNNVIEVWLYGVSTGISNLALLVAAVFWTWLWGTPGLFLSTPLTVCLLVIGKYVPGLRFFSMLLGSGPVLEPPAQFYQRMLSKDAEEMLDLATKHVDDHSLTDFYDNVFVPALLMSEEDRHGGSLAEVRQKFIFQSSRELIEELERRGDHNEQKSPEQPPMRARTSLVLGVPARDDADEIVARMLRHLLHERGVQVQLADVTTSALASGVHLEKSDIQVAFVSALPPSALVAARQTCRRLKEQSPGAHIVVGIWTREATPDELRTRLRHPQPEEVVTTLSEAVAQIERLAALAPAEAEGTAPVPATEEQRVEEVQRLKLIDAEPEELFDTVTRELAAAFNVPISLVSIVDADRQFWKSHVGLPADLAAAQSADRDTSICGHLVATDDLLVVPDVAKDKRFAELPFVTERGVRFYAGAPLRTHKGHVVGSLCIIDTKPRTISERDKSLLRLRAAELMEAVELRSGEPAEPAST